MVIKIIADMIQHITISNNAKSSEYDNNRDINFDIRKRSSNVLSSSDLFCELEIGCIVLKTFSPVFEAIILIKSGEATFEPRST